MDGARWPCFRSNGAAAAASASEAGRRDGGHASLLLPPTTTEPTQVEGRRRRHCTVHFCGKYARHSLSSAEDEANDADAAAAAAAAAETRRPCDVSRRLSFETSSSTHFNSETTNYNAVEK